MATTWIGKTLNASKDLSADRLQDVLELINNSKIGKLSNTSVGKKVIGGAFEAAVIGGMLAEVYPYIKREAALSGKQAVAGLGKAALLSALTDTALASAEAAYHLVRGKMTRREALRHVIKETSNGATSNMVGIGTIVLLGLFPAISVATQIAVLTGVNIATRKLINKPSNSHF